MPEFYFSGFEDRKPPAPVPYSISRELLWQFFATINLSIGAWYIIWRWQHSLNYEALWFAIPLVIAETCAYVGLILFAVNLWAVRDARETPPPQVHECLHSPGEFLPEKLTIDVFFPTYDEDPELVRFSIRDAKKITYPHPADILIHVLDDGNRPAMKAVAASEGVNYISRTTNVGFKAGNLQNAMKQTCGEFILICDADTRPFPTILEHTLGYFRDPHVAWVQTPQWFYDIPEGTPLHQILQKRLGKPGYLIGRGVEKIFGPVNIGQDPFSNDPQMFYDVIQRRRNWANASFCCGAASVHRREAIQLMALRNRGLELEGLTKKFEEAEAGLLKQFRRFETKFIKAASGITDREYRANFSKAMTEVWQKNRETVRKSIRHSAYDVNLFFLENPVPYKHHVSEDMYTSLILHAEIASADTRSKWRSVLHPGIESKMLSTQDLLSWTIQRFKYAGGTLDVAWRERHRLFKNGLSLAQKLMYGATFWSYIGCLWNVVFLCAPIIYLFTGVPPVSVYSTDFFKHFFPFIIANTLAMMVGTWGVSAWSGQSTYLSFFAVNLKAIRTIMRNERRQFPRIKTDLPGVCIRGNRREEIVIRDMSRFGMFGASGLQIELNSPKKPDVGDELTLTFDPDNKKHASVREDVIVRNISGNRIGVEYKPRNEEKIKFTVTPKIRQEKNFVKLVIPQITVIVLTLVGILYAGIMWYLGYREDIVALLANTFWGSYNIIALSGIVRAAFWKPGSE
ncbi:cellulose synthase [Desulfonema ishimotonii]|uniref:Cellulose synthase n=1 Tax=Desulfonema ishimotonii TaxID=45657 RepID=A0A401FTR8_9BACT|nr:glycosyltransferase [Desulfonema ishimotonii]GBC60353.1 cellulose synthase [Desulfonema ishimotonii]